MIGGCQEQRGSIDLGNKSIIILMSPMINEPRLNVIFDDAAGLRLIAESELGPVLVRGIHLVSISGHRQDDKELVPENQIGTPRSIS